VLYATDPGLLSVPTAQISVRCHVFHAFLRSIHPQNSLKRGIWQRWSVNLDSSAFGMLCPEFQDSVERCCGDLSEKGAVIAARVACIARAM
jgi:hypothetical protein